jgi:putative peptidoglycan lipid II flippase
VFERGNFTFENTQIVANCLRILGFALPFVVYMKVFSSIFFSYENTKTPMFIALWCALINIIVSVALLKPFGIYGIIIGSSVSYFADALITFIMLKNRGLILLDLKKLTAFNCKILFSSAVFGIFCFFFFTIYSKTNYYNNIFEYSLLVKFLYLSVISAFGIIIYIILLKILGVKIKEKIAIK